METISFCIAICSRRRPLLLTQALETIMALDVPEHIDFSILIVENDDKPQYANIVTSLDTKIPIHYALEPAAGLTHARNKMLTTALELDVDWLGSIDDDVVLQKDWLVEMARAIKTYPDTGFFYGNWKRTKAPGAPSWYPHPSPLKAKATGSKIKFATGGNIAVRKSVFAAEGMALRFDHQFKFSGGEDIDFCRQYSAEGGIIRSVYEAVGTEEIHQERSDLPERLKRYSDSMYTVIKVRHKHLPLPLSLLWSIQIVYRGTVLGAANVIIGGVAMPFNRYWGLKRYGVGLSFFAGAGGAFRYYFGKDREPYRHVVGH